MTGNVHIERRGASAQQMIMHGSDLNPAREHFRHYGIDLGFEQYVAHRHDTAMHRLECDPTAERQRRLDGHAVKRHREIVTREAVSMYVARDGGLAA